MDWDGRALVADVGEEGDKKKALGEFRVVQWNKVVVSTVCGPKVKQIGHPEKVAHLENGPQHASRDTNLS